MASASPEELVVSGTVTATGNSGPLTLSDKGTSLNLFVPVSAVGGSGGPSLTLSIQWSQDGTNFVPADPADSMSPITAVGGAVKQFSIKGPYFRISWTLAGTTPSFTFSVWSYTTGAV